MSLNRNVTACVLHESLFVRGAGELGKVFPPETGGGKTLANLTMTATEVGLVIKGKRVAASYTNGGEFEELVPWATVKQASLGKQE